MTLEKRRRRTHRVKHTKHNGSVHRKHNRSVHRKHNRSVHRRRRTRRH